MEPEQKELSEKSFKKFLEIESTKNIDKNSQKTFSSRDHALVLKWSHFKVVKNTGLLSSSALGIALLPSVAKLFRNVISPSLLNDLAIVYFLFVLVFIYLIAFSLRAPKTVKLFSHATDLKVKLRSQVSENADHKREARNIFMFADCAFFKFRVALSLMFYILLLVVLYSSWPKFVFMASKINFFA